MAKSLYVAGSRLAIRLHANVAAQARISQCTGNDLASHVVSPDPFTFFSGIAMRQRRRRRARGALRNIKSMNKAALAMSKRMQSANELALAAAQTIGHRIASMRGAMNGGRSMASPEVARMGMEKISAATTADSAMLASAVSMQRLCFDLWLGQMRQAASAGQAFLNARTPVAAAAARRKRGRSSAGERHRSRLEGGRIGSADRRRGLEALSLRRIRQRNPACHRCLGLAVPILSHCR